MSVCLLVMTDGRDDVLAQTIRSAEERLHGHITRKVIHSDNGQWHVDGLRAFYPQWEVIGGRRLGFGGAVNRAWRHIADGSEPFVFATEDDFTYNRPVDLGRMADVLTENPNLVQLVLKRQPWNDDERRAGGIIEQHPEDYADRTDAHGNHWVEHRRFYSTNPTLIRRSLCSGGWPVCPQSEGMFTHQLLEDPDVRFAFWGQRDDEPWVTHIGVHRVGRGY